MQAPPAAVGRKSRPCLCCGLCCGEFRYSRTHEHEYRTTGGPGLQMRDGDHRQPPPPTCLPYFIKLAYGEKLRNLSLTNLNRINFRTKRVHNIIFHTRYVMMKHHQAAQSHSTNNIKKWPFMYHRSATSTQRPTPLS